MDLFGVTELGDAGDASPGFVNLDVIKDEEATAFVGGSGGGIEFSRVLTFGVRVQLFTPPELEWLRSVSVGCLETGQDCGFFG